MRLKPGSPRCTQRSSVVEKFDARVGRVRGVRAVKILREKKDVDMLNPEIHCVNICLVTTNFSIRRETFFFLYCPLQNASDNNCHEQFQN